MFFQMIWNMVCRAALTSLLAPSQPMEGVVVPGSKSTKYKKERDLVGLSGDQVRRHVNISRTYFSVIFSSSDVPVHCRS